MYQWNNVTKEPRKLIVQVIAGQRKADRGLKKARLRPAVETLTFEAVSMN